MVCLRIIRIGHRYIIQQLCSNQEETSIKCLFFCTVRKFMKLIDLPMGTADVVRFDRGEIDRLITLVFSTSIFGWFVN